MKRSELIAFFDSQEFTNAQAYNLLTQDMEDGIPLDVQATPGGQMAIQYFREMIELVLLPAMHELKARHHGA